MTDLPEWIHVGATVAESSDHHSYTRHKVERFTATQIVLSNGARYRKQDWNEREQCFIRHTGGAWGHRYRLVPGDRVCVLESDVRACFNALRHNIEDTLSFRSRDNGRGFRPSVEEHVAALARVHAMAKAASEKVTRLADRIEEARRA